MRNCYDKYYNFYVENYEYLCLESKKWFDKRKNYSFEQWAKSIAYYADRNLDSEEYENAMNMDYKIRIKTNGIFCLALHYFGGYKNKIYIRHNSKKCNYYKFWANPQTLMQNGIKCPICSASLGEESIRLFLESRNIKFIPQYSFDNLKGKKHKNMPFDFAVFDNDKLKFLVEFDGVYHYKINKRNTELSLRHQRERDAIKTEYCKKYNIKLIRIPYWEYKNIESILMKEL